MLTRCLDYWEISKKKLVSGNLTSQDKEKIKEARKYWKEHYAEMYGGILVNARKKIIYTPEDKVYQKKYLNRTIKRPKEK